ncbi:class I SAM-dependent methyltransferase [Mesorhizobium sp. GbtcB19]|uniref:class I SAM-dependent methyltransferase n=1 Tax=Mesorhizobium sp. GbtcB19 TaxID=2824764 RepID=UPI001C303CC4|nr:class I SAM-dependent methyltransferase [Mesorhizobium sp. GbtcB19]
MMNADFASWFEGKALSTDWTSRFFPVWATLLAARREAPLDVLEIGSWEGRSAIFFLRYLASCRLTCIDSFEGSTEHALRLKWSNQLPHIEQRFDFNLAEFQGRFEKLKAMSSAALAGLIAERRRFDLIYIDGSHHSADVLADAVASWQMIDKGGLIIFDDYEWAFFADEADRPKLGVDTFLARHKGEYRELHRGEQLIIQKTVPLEAANPRTDRTASFAKPLPDNPAKSVEFVLIAEAGVLEAQALLLCESIRSFAGSYSQCPIIVVSPRSDRRPSASTIQKLEQMGVEYLPLEIDSCCPQYGTSWRIHSLAAVERRPGPPVIVQLDSDAVFIGEPDLLLEDCDAAARPVDSKGMCTTGPGDAFDPYWRDLCGLAGVEYEHLPVVWTSDGAAVVRASYNGGLIAARRSCALFQRTEGIFRQLVAAELKPWRTDQPTYRTGTGLQSGEATAYWGTSQAALSLAAVAGNHAVRHLPATHNFPLHNLARTKAPDPAKLIHIHYHGLFSANSSEANPIFDGRLELPAGIAEWLQARLPLPEEPQPADEKARSVHAKREAILILGMHRSGTSVLGGMVNALGVAGPHSLMSGDRHNPTGYWESLRLNAATNDLLAAAGSGWHDWLPLDPGWMASEVAQGHRHRIEAILESEFGDAALFFIKEPRSCRFLPWMSSILADMRIDTAALLPIRNPLEVAYSIERRDGFPVAGSLLVWLRHVLDAELHSRHMPRSFLLYEDLLADWQGQLTKASRAIDLAWPIRPEQAGSDVESFLSQELHHQRCTVDQLRDHRDAPPIVADAYAILRAMARDGDSQDLRDQLDGIRVKLDSASALVGRTFAGERAAARRSVDDLQSRLGEFHTQSEQLHAIVAELHRDRDAVLGDRDRLLRENAARSGEREALLHERDALHREREALYREREGLVTAREAMLASHSWRLTAPLRWLRNPFAKRGE